MDLFYFWNNFHLLRVIGVQKAATEEAYDTVEVEFLDTGRKLTLTTREELPSPDSLIITDYSENGWLNEYYYCRK